MPRLLPATAGVNNKNKCNVYDVGSYELSSLYKVSSVLLQYASGIKMHVFLLFNDSMPDSCHVVV